MKKPLHILKKWFETGDVPTEQQFHDAFDSFHHKDNGELLVEKKVNEAGDVTFKFTDGEVVTIEKFVPDTSKPMEYIDGLIKILNTLTTKIETLQTHKVDKEGGKGLSEANFSQSEKEKLADLENYIPESSEPITFIEGLQAFIDEFTQNLTLKVAKQDGKGLSETNFSQSEKEKLAGLKPFEKTEIAITNENDIKKFSITDKLSFGKGIIFDPIKKRIDVDAANFRELIVKKRRYHHVRTMDTSDTNTLLMTKLFKLESKIMYNFQTSFNYVAYKSTRFVEKPIKVIFKIYLSLNNAFFIRTAEKRTPTKTTRCLMLEAELDTSNLQKFLGAEFLSYTSIDFTSSIEPSSIGHKNDMSDTVIILSRLYAFTKKFDTNGNAISSSISDYVIQPLSFKDQTELAPNEKLNYSNIDIENIDFKIETELEVEYADALNENGKNYKTTMFIYAPYALIEKI